MIENPLLTNKSEYKSKVLDEKVLNLLDKTFVIPKDFRYNVIIITKEIIARPDIISRNIYGTDKYQDILCKLNGISNPFEMNEGDYLIVPDINNLEDFYYKEKASEIEHSEGDEMSVPKPKGKSEKRKPNEAVIGEKRYKIDSTKKIIIY